MNYVIKPIFPKIGEEKEITEDEFLKIVDALQLAWNIILVKELFSYVMRNYCLLESEINRIKLNAKNDPDNFYKSVSEGAFRLNNTHTFNLLVSNLLSACRSYLEVYDYKGKNKDKEVFFNKDDIRSKLREAKNDYHDKNFLCVFFWELRNYAQHHSSPITGSPLSIDYGILSIDYSINAEKILKKLTSRQQRKLEVSNIVEDFKDYLEQKQNCLSAQELQKYPKKLNLRQLTKQYILSINALHEEINKLLDPKLKKTKEILIQKVEYYCNDSSPSSAFQICKIGKANDDSNKCFDVQVQLINQWEETIKRYSDLDIKDIN